MSSYMIKDRKVFTTRGKLVATLDDDGNPVMALGMAGPHTRGVREFLGFRYSVSEGTKQAAPEEASDVKENLTTDDPEEVVKENLTTEQSGPKMYVGEPAAAKADPGCPAQEAEREKTVDEFLVDGIPDDQLPDLSPEYGVYTPGFQEFVEINRLSPAQVAALINRINNKKR